MKLADAIRLARKKTRSRLGTLSFFDKTTTGLGLAVIVLLAAACVAGFGVHAARTNAEALRIRHLPLMETALALEVQVYEAVFHVGMFGASGDADRYSAARIRFANMRKTASNLAAQAAGAPETHALVRDVDLLLAKTKDLDRVVEKKRTLNEALEAERLKLRETADALNETLLELQARTAAVTTPKGSDESLNEKARLLALNGFALAVEEVAGRALAASATRNEQDLAEARAYFANRWGETRETCLAASALPASAAAAATRRESDLAGDMEALATAQLASMQSILLILEESGRVNGERTEVASGLSSLARNVVALARANMEIAATNSDKALRGATAALSACALLACGLAACAGAALLRSKPKAFP